MYWTNGVGNLSGIENPLRRDSTSALPTLARTDLIDWVCQHVNWTRHQLCGLRRRAESAEVELVSRTVCHRLVEIHLTNHIVHSQCLPRIDGCCSTHCGVFSEFVFELSLKPCWNKRSVCSTATMIVWKRESDPSALCYDMCRRILTQTTSRIDLDQLGPQD